MTILCTLLGLWCPHLFPPLELCPKPDITAFELALLTRGQYDPDALFTARPGLLRHTAERGRCAL